MGGKQQFGPVGALAHVFQRAAQFRLEQYNSCNKADLHHIGQHPAHRAQLHHIRQRIKHQQQQQTAHQLPGTGFARKQKDLIHGQTDHRNIDHITQAKRAQVAQNVLDHIKKAKHRAGSPLPIRCSAAVSGCGPGCYLLGCI